MVDPLPRPVGALTIPPQTNSTGPQPSVSPRMEALLADVADGRQDSVAAFWRELESLGTPLVEELPGEPSLRIVTFVAREENPDVEVLLFANKVTGPEAYSRAVLTRVPGTEVRYLSFAMRADWRAQYTIGRAASRELPPPARQLVERSLAAGASTDRATLERWHGALATARADPLHRRGSSWAARVTEASWVELPAAAPAGIDLEPVEPSGVVRHLRFDSNLLGNERDVWVYTPAEAHLTSTAPRGALVLLDGQRWAKGGLINRLLDGAIRDGRLPPLTAVWGSSIDVPTRVRELACMSEFVDALDQELLPRIPELPSGLGPERTVIAGTSLGGLTAAYAALRAPHRFGHVLSQSGSFWWPTTLVEGEEPAWLTRCYAAVDRLPVRFHLEVGLQESVLLGPTRHLRDVLIAKGYPVTYREVNGGHDALWWTATLASAVAGLTADWH